MKRGEGMQKRNWTSHRSGSNRSYRRNESRTHTHKDLFVSFLCLGRSAVRWSVCFKEDEKQASQVGWGQCGRGKLMANDDVTAKLTCCTACCHKVGLDNKFVDNLVLYYRQWVAWNSSFTTGNWKVSLLRSTSCSVSTLTLLTRWAVIELCSCVCVCLRETHSLCCCGWEHTEAQ